MFKTNNISGFISFLLYTAFIGVFVGLGACMGAYCFPAYEAQTDVEAQAIVEKMKEIDKQNSSDMTQNSEEIRRRMKSVVGR